MKLSEALSEAKQLEGELMRLYATRDAIMRQGFREEYDHSLAADSMEKIAELKKVFLIEKAEKVERLEKEIDILRDRVITKRAKLNRKNIEIGLDTMLQQMKYLRLELSKLMNLTKKENRYSSEGLDISVQEVLNLPEKIKKLERIKSKLDSEIQKLNWSTEL